MDIKFLRFFILQSFILGAFFLYGCKDITVNAPPLKIIFNSKKSDGFFVISSWLDNSQKPKYIKYLFNGVALNQTDQIFANGFLKMVIYFELENGNLLNEQEINSNPFGDIKSIQSFKNWKPNESIYLTSIESISIPVDYIDYPIKDVKIDCVIEYEDQINKIAERKLIKSVSVLKSWRNAVEKVKNNKVDVVDSDFPRSIIY